MKIDEVAVVEPRQHALVRFAVFLRVREIAGTRRCNGRLTSRKMTRFARGRLSLEWVQVMRYGRVVAISCKSPLEKPVGFIVRRIRIDAGRLLTS